MWKISLFSVKLPHDHVGCVDFNNLQDVCHIYESSEWPHLRTQTCLLATEKLLFGWRESQEKQRPEICLFSPAINDPAFRIKWISRVPVPFCGVMGLGQVLSHAVKWLQIHRLLFGTVFRWRFRTLMSYGRIWTCCCRCCSLPIRGRITEFTTHLKVKTCQRFRFRSKF